MITYEFELHVMMLLLALHHHRGHINVKRLQNHCTAVLGHVTR